MAEVSRRLLFLGGSGRVGSMVVPLLRPQFSVRVLDLVEPSFDCDDFVRGLVLDDDLLRRCVDDVDFLVYSVMPDLDLYTSIRVNHDLNVKGLHLALEACRRAAVKKALFLSTFDVYRRLGSGLASEDAPAGTDKVYGLTKMLGESVCRMFGDYHDMTVVALRLYEPMPDREWRDKSAQGTVLGVAASDLAEAIRCVFRLAEPGYQVFSISGDYAEERVNMRRAKEVLGWRPRAQCRLPDS